MIVATLTVTPTSPTTQSRAPIVSLTYANNTMSTLYACRPTHLRLHQTIVASLKQQQQSSRMPIYLDNIAVKIRQQQQQQQQQPIKQQLNKETTK